MTLSMFDVSVPVFLRGLANLDAVLGKAESHARAKNFDAVVLFGARLYPDMFPLSRQVQICSDMAKGCAARLAGLEVPRYDDTETTLGELRDRISRTLAFLRTLEPGQFHDAETREIVLPLRTRTLQFEGKAYVLDFVLPNFYFHATTTYAILRHNGVELGKADFLGPID